MRKDTQTGEYNSQGAWRAKAELARQGKGWPIRRLSNRMKPMGSPAPSRVFQGLGVSAGIGTGVILLLHEAGALIDRRRSAADAKAEILRYRAARENVRERFRQAASHLLRDFKDTRANILDAHALILQDLVINQETELLIESGKTAEVAVEAVFQGISNRGKSIKSGYLRDSFAVSLEVGEQLVMELLGSHRLDAARGKGDVIIAARELSAFSLVNHPENIKGFALESGGATGHAAILARAYKVPMVVGIRDIHKTAEDGAAALIDGGTGELFLRPPADILEKRRGPAVAPAPSTAPKTQSDLAPARTKDGRRILLLANIESVQGISACKRYGADGVGLLRSEFLFLHRQRYL